MENVVISQLTGSAFVVFAIQWLKKSPWFPFVTAKTDKLNRALGIVGAFATSIGIHGTWHWATGGSITIPAGAVLIASLWHWLNSVAVQEVTYRVVKAAGNGNGNGGGK